MRSGTIFSFPLVNKIPADKAGALREILKVYAREEKLKRPWHVCYPGQFRVSEI